MQYLQVFIVAFLVSYLGSIPPGSINVTVMQMSIQRQNAAALAFGLGAVMVEFAYASMAVRFLQLLISDDQLYFYLQGITAIGLIGLGFANLLKKKRDAFRPQKVRKRNGFAKGILLGLVNPLTIPFWLGVTTYLLSQNIVSLDDSLFWFYTLGLALGTYTLLVTVNIFANKFQRISNNQIYVYKIPGAMFLSMGTYYLFLVITSV